MVFSLCDCGEKIIMTENAIFAIKKQRIVEMAKNIAINI